MAQPLTEGGRIVKEAIAAGHLQSRAQGFKRRLARILFQEHGEEVFKSEETCRKLIRDYTGASGPQSSKHAPRVYSPFAQPDDFYWPKAKTITIPKRIEKIGIISDVHMPYADWDAVNAAFKDFAQRGIHALILNGDIIDCGESSSWGKSDSTPPFHRELDELFQFMCHVEQNFPDIDVYYKIGNHEDRLRKKIWRLAPEIGRQFDFFKISGLTDFGVKKANYADPIMFADLKIYHGHEIRTSAFVYPAKTVWGRTHGSENITMGHLHTTDQWPRIKRPNAKTIYYSGCLCTLQATYDPSSHYRWNLGYQYAERHKDTFILENISL